jgi:hypothetical protein
MPNETDQTKAYSEACNALRHYSTASLGIRSASVVQGLLILLAWVNAQTQATPKPLILFALPIVGFVFAGLLFRFHMAYFRAAEFFYGEAAKMEQRFFDEDCRPISAYDKFHKEKYASFCSKFFTLNAPFTLICTLCTIAFLADLLIPIFSK